MNRQVLVKTTGDILKEATNNTILAMVNQNTTPQGATFLLATVFDGGTIRIETDIHIAVDKGDALRFEIMAALDLMGIQASNMYANSRWSRWMMHDIPAQMGMTNTTRYTICWPTNFTEWKGYQSPRPPDG